MVSELHDVRIKECQNFRVSEFYRCQFPKKINILARPNKMSLIKGRGRAWLAQLVRSLPSDHKVPSSIPGFAEIRIFVQPSFPPKPTQLSILPG